MCNKKVAVWIVCFLALVLFAGSVPAKDRNFSLSLKYFIKGMLFEKEYKFKEAIEQFEKAKEYDFESTEIHMHLARLYLIEKKYVAAEKELQLVKEFDPDNLEARTLLVLLYREQKRDDALHEELEDLLTKACILYPDNLGMFLFLADFYAKNEDFTRALEVLQSYSTSHPDDTEVFFYIGGLYYDQQDLKTAESYWLKVLEADKEHKDALNSLAYIYALQGKNLEKALVYVNRALEQDPYNGAYLDTLGWIYYKKGNPDKALTYIKKAAESMEDPVIYEHMGDIYFKLKKYDKAKEFWEKSLQLIESEEVQGKLEEVTNLLEKGAK